MIYEWQHCEMKCTETSREQDPTMGRPSDKQRSAQRPGQRERKRVKRSRRGALWASVTGVWDFHAKVGRKKWHRVYVALNRMQRESRSISGEAHLERRENRSPEGQPREQLGQDQPTHPSDERMTSSGSPANRCGELMIS